MDTPKIASGLKETEEREAPLRTNIQIFTNLFRLDAAALVLPPGPTRVMDLSSACRMEIGLIGWWLRNLCQCRRGINAELATTRTLTRITQYRTEGLRDSEWPNHLYFGSNHKLYKMCTKGSLYTSCTDVYKERRRPRRRRPVTVMVTVAGRRPVPSTGQNTVLPAHSDLRHPFTTEERIRSDRS